MRVRWQYCLLWEPLYLFTFPTLINYSTITFIFIFIFFWLFARNLEIPTQSWNNYWNRKSSTDRNLLSIISNKIKLNYRFLYFRTLIPCNKKCVFNVLLRIRYNFLIFTPHYRIRDNSRKCIKDFNFSSVTQTNLFFLVLLIATGMNLVTVKNPSIIFQVVNSVILLAKNGQ